MICNALFPCVSVCDTLASYRSNSLCKSRLRFFFGRYFKSLNVENIKILRYSSSHCHNVWMRVQPYYPLVRWYKVKMAYQYNGVSPSLLTVFGSTPISCNNIKAAFKLPHITAMNNASQPLMDFKDGSAYPRREVALTFANNYHFVHTNEELILSNFLHNNSPGHTIHHD